MIKQPETRDRFRITADVEPEALGPLLAQLARIGLQNIGYELITDVVTFKNRIAHATDNVDLAKTWVAEHPTFQAIELVQHFEANGRSRNTGYAAIKNLIESRDLVRVSPGHYARSDIKAIAPPANSKTANAQAEAPVKRTRRGQTPQYDGPKNLDLILKFIKPRTRVSVKQVQAMLEKEGRNRKSASPIISKLAANKVLKLVEPGVYDVKKTPAPASKAESLNGAEAHGS